MRSATKYGVSGAARIRTSTSWKPKPPSHTTGDFAQWPRTDPESRPAVSKRTPGVALELQNRQILALEASPAGKVTSPNTNTMIRNARILEVAWQYQDHSGSASIRVPIQGPGDLLSGPAESWYIAGR